MSQSVRVPDPLRGVGLSQIIFDEDIAPIPMPYHKIRFETYNVRSRMSPVNGYKISAQYVFGDIANFLRTIATFANTGRVIGGITCWEESQTNSICLTAEIETKESLQERSNTSSVKYVPSKIQKAVDVSINKKKEEENPDPLWLGEPEGKK